MWLFAVAALAFNVFMAFSLYKAVSTEEADGWSDYLSTVLVAVGSLSGIIVSIRVLLI